MVNIFPTPLVSTVHVRSIFQHVLCRRKGSHEIPTPVTALDQGPQYSNTSCALRRFAEIFNTSCVPKVITILFSNTSTTEYHFPTPVLPKRKKIAVSQHQLWLSFLYYLFFYPNTRCIQFRVSQHHSRNFLLEFSEFSSSRSTLSFCQFEVLSSQFSSSPFCHFCQTMTQCITRCSLFTVLSLWHLFLYRY